MRIKLLDHLREQPATVGELQAATASSQQNVSKHLGVLHDAGLLRRRKDGNFVRYEIADPAVFELCDIRLRQFHRQLAELDRLLEATGRT